MQITVSAVRMFEETEADFKNFPERLPENTDQNIEEDYAVAFLSPKTHKSLISSPQLNLRIHTFYGEIVVRPEIEVKLSDRVTALPLSPYVFILHPLSAN